MRPFSFRRKVVLAAVALVAIVQLATLLPVLDAVEDDANARAQRALRLAGVVFEEHMSTRADRLLTAANVLAADAAFTQAVATRDDAAVRAALGSHAAKAHAKIALLLDSGGRIISSSIESQLPSTSALPLPVDFAPDRFSSVVDVEGIAHHAVIVPAPIASTRIMLGYPIDEALARELSSLVGLDVSIVRSGGDAPLVASTLSPDERSRALAGLDPGDPFGLQRTGADPAAGYLTLLRPFIPGSRQLHVALQLPLAHAMSMYARIRGLLLVAAGLSLVLAIGGACWLANAVTRRVETLRTAAQRTAEGNYGEPIEIPSRDELGELAGELNAMQRAVADREQRILHQAHHDSLTGLPSRDLVIGQLRGALEKHAVVSLVSLTLDRFDSVVTSLGHRAADELVVLVAGLLRNRMQEDQPLGHLGGHEFVLALPDHDAEQAVEWSAQLLDQLRAGVRVAGANVSLRGVIGISSCPLHGRDAAELVRRASIARSEARQRSEPVVVYRLGQEDRFLEQLRIVGDFPKALRGEELELRFQPQIDCVSHRVRGIEALVRWRHPQLGLLAPDRFVDAIEQAGAISHLTRWVLAEAVRHLSRFRRQGIELALAANISVDDLLDEYLPYYLLDLVKKNELVPSDVTLEITESAIMRNVHKSASVVSCIHELGFRIAVDDFGVGQSALAQLKRLPVDELKIDKSFVMNLRSSKDEAIVRTAIELAHHLRLDVVAEGVESADILERLRELGCESAQGYYIAEPLAPAELPPWLAAWSAKRETPVIALAGREGRRSTSRPAGPRGLDEAPAS